MNDFHQFVNKVQEHKKSNQFQKALDYFKNEKVNFSSEQIASDKYLISNIIASLRKTNKSNFVNNLIATYKIIINESTDEILLNAYGWALYDISKNEVSNNNYNKEKLLQTIEYPIHLISLKNSNFSYSIISNIFRLVLKVEKHKLNQDWNFINNFCNLFNPEILNLECGTSEIRGKTTEFASDKENWYATKSKALFELNYFQECYETSKLAISNIDSFHYNNDLWFARRIALSKKALGNIHEAIEDLEQIYIKRKEWFIKKELADLYFETGDIKKAFEYSIDAICKNGFSKLEFKIGLILLLAKILKIQNELDLSIKHFLLVKTIRDENGWKLPQELLDELNKVQSEQISSELLKKELTRYWKSFQPKLNSSIKNNNLQNGQIKIILNDNEKGKNGFLTSNKIDYYFLLPKHIEFLDKININTKVKFNIIKLDDGKERAKILEVLE
ncbi:MAG: hypothetical protein QM490_02440 [Candidatus Gracilibacteria bacterium]